MDCNRTRISEGTSLLRRAAKTAGVPRRHTSVPNRDTTFTMLLADGRCLAWSEFGTRDGFPVLAFAPLAGVRTFGRWFSAGAEQSNLRLISCDRPGFGLSTPMQGVVGHTFTR